ncbi:MAG: DUF4124 domain-containing protein [Woeseiaceae bacterium]|nr:DUF4124 domain-containing protein [Woeseiaceae bacterium]
MNRLRLPTAIACAALLASGIAMGGEIYKWVDEDGNVHYEDRPTGDGNIERVVEVRTRNTDNAAVAARVDEQRKARAAARQVESEAPEEMSKEELRAEQQARHDKCQSYRAQLQAFLTAPRMYEEDEAGERNYLDDEQILAARSDVEEKIQEYCGAS